eukprot:scaffold1867_cov247-Pinguiococcus_pyrenoidosus.AAC.13
MIWPTTAASTSKYSVGLKPLHRPSTCKQPSSSSAATISAFDRATLSAISAMPSPLQSAAGSSTGSSTWTDVISAFSALRSATSASTSSTLPRQVHAGLQSHTHQGSRGRQSCRCCLEARATAGWTCPSEWLESFSPTRRGAHLVPYRRASRPTQRMPSFPASAPRAPPWKLCTAESARWKNPDRSSATPSAACLAVTGRLQPSRSPWKSRRARAQAECRRGSPTGSRCCFESVLAGRFWGNLIRNSEFGIRTEVGIWHLAENREKPKSRKAEKPKSGEDRRPSESPEGSGVLGEGFGSASLAELLRRVLNYFEYISSVSTVSRSLMTGVTYTPFLIFRS